jgi:hypothetical protein
LLDALRFAHWSVVARFEERVRTWPATELAALYLDLADHADAAPRTWLLEHGLEAEARLDDGSRLFDALLDHLPASLAAVRQLLDAGATPAGAGRFGPALARLNDGEGAAFAFAMLERGADAFGADADHRTPLHHASRPGMLPVLRALLARGADPNARDRAGATPLHVALDGKPDEVLPLVKALIAHGADPESPAASGETPLAAAQASAARRRPACGRRRSRFRGAFAGTRPACGCTRQPRRHRAAARERRGRAAERAAPAGRAR